MKEGAKPYHGRPYPIAQIHKATLMKEINRLQGIGVLKRQSSSQWASPTFIIPKKALRHNTSQAQEPVSTRNATKRAIEILDAKYDKANLPAIVKDNCSHLTPSQ